MANTNFSQHVTFVESAQVVAINSHSNPWRWADWKKEGVAHAFSQGEG